VIRHSRPNIKRAELASVLTGVLENLISDNIADGAVVRDFEKAFCEFHGQKGGGAVAVGSGLDALFFGLRALGIGPGDEVILPSYLPTAPYLAVRHAGATPVVCDIGPDYAISAESARAAITERTKAIIVAHLFGLPADLAALAEIGVPLIEDCAQALGARYRGELVGADACRFSFFSFHSSKMMTTGHGGMFFSRDTRLAAAVRDMRSYSARDDLEPAWNSNITDFQAAMGIDQLKSLPRFIEKRRQIADIYIEQCMQAHVEVLPAFEGRENVFCRFPIRVRHSLKDAIEYLRKNAVEAKSPIARPLHKMLGLAADPYPESEKAFLKTLSIPIYPALPSQEVEYITKLIAHIQ
jgi:dTDP-4-amino-4,6-dideoxygalactose transaminase